MSRPMQKEPLLWKLSKLTFLLIMIYYSLNLLNTKSGPISNKFIELYYILWIILLLFWKQNDNDVKNDSKNTYLTKYDALIISVFLIKTSNVKRAFLVWDGSYISSYVYFGLLKYPSINLRNPGWFSQYKQYQKKIII